MPDENTPANNAAADETKPTAKPQPAPAPQPAPLPAPGEAAPEDGDVDVTYHGPHGALVLPGAGPDESDVTLERNGEPFRMLRSLAEHLVRHLPGHDISISEPSKE